LDPDGILSPDAKVNFLALLKEFDRVFDPTITGYNGAAGPIKGVVNMGPVQPPQRKGRMPQYARDQLEQLQTKFDELEAMGVFQRPEDLNIVAEYLNPSFLVKKRSGGFRLITAFTDVGRYSKPQPSLMPDVDSTLRKIACWPTSLYLTCHSHFSRYHYPEAHSNTVVWQPPSKASASTPDAPWACLAPRRRWKS
jgi:hypothetical protein